MNKPHLAIACTQHRVGDIRVFSRLACGFAALGWRVSLLAPPIEPIPEMPAGVDYYPVKRVLGYLRRLFFAGGVVPLLKQLSPDIVIFPDPELMPVLLNYKRRTSRVVVFDRHEVFDKLETLAVYSWLERLLLRAYVHYERYAATRLNGVIVVLAEMIEALPPATNTIVAHNYPTRASLKALAAPTPPHTPRFTCVHIGAIYADRYFDELLALVHELVVVRGKRDFTLCLGGQFEPGLMARAQAFIAKHKLASNVTIIPDRVPHENVLRLVRASRIGLSPYRRNVIAQNTLQNKILEFMAAGLPVITSPSSKNGEVVKRSDCGRLFWAEQIEEIADTVQEWMENPEEAERLGQRGRAYVLEYLVWEEELVKLEQWLLNMLPDRQD